MSSRDIHIDKFALGNVNDKHIVTMYGLVHIPHFQTLYCWHGFKALDKYSDVIANCVLGVFVGTLW